ncbi:MAG TPA: fructosamine kinase family protein [Rhodocyclaceae bacterium]
MQADFAALFRAAADGATVGGARSVSGGSIHAAWRVDTSAGPLFVKLNDAECAPLFTAEAAGLQRLAETQTVRVPAVRGSGTEGDRAWLALEWLDLQPLDRDGGGRLGEQLAALHRISSDHFGLDHDNHIGLTPQLNAPHADWPWFFAHRRLQPQLELARSKGLERETVERGLKLVEKLAGIFVGRRIVPALIHGDLWSGNAAMLADGTPVIFDPAIHFADREADLAMAELFGGFPASFYAAYRRAAPLAEGYEQRKALYNLYHMLNHYNLFGASYLGQVKRMIDGLTAALR